MLGEFVTTKFLLFVEEIALRLHGQEAHFIAETARLKNLLMEIFKRLP